MIKKKPINTDKLLEIAKQYKAMGWTSKKIAQYLGLSTTRFKHLLYKAKLLKKLEDVEEIK